MACGAFSPERALAISACFFAMTTGATDATVKALNLRTQTLADLGSRTLHSGLLTSQRDRLDHAPLYRLVSSKRPTFGNPAGTRPTAWYRKASRAIPSYTRMQDICPPTNHGFAGASRPSATQPDLDHEQPAHPPHGIAERPERFRPAPVCKTQANPQTMVSQKRPKGSANPRARVVIQTQRPWCRRSVPRSTLATSVPPVINLGFPVTHNKDGPSWSVRLLAAPRSVGPAVSTKTTPPISSADQ